MIQVPILAVPHYEMGLVFNSVLMDVVFLKLDSIGEVVFYSRTPFYMPSPFSFLYEYLSMVQSMLPKAFSRFRNIPEACCFLSQNVYLESRYRLIGDVHLFICSRTYVVLLLKYC